MVYILNNLKGTSCYLQHRCRESLSTTPISQNNLLFAAPRFVCAHAPDHRGTSAGVLEWCTCWAGQDERFSWFPTSSRHFFRILSWIFDTCSMFQATTNKKRGQKELQIIVLEYDCKEARVSIPAPNSMKRRENPRFCVRHRDVCRRQNPIQTCQVISINKHRFASFFIYGDRDFDRGKSIVCRRWNFRKASWFRQNKHIEKTERPSLS